MDTYETRTMKITPELAAEWLTHHGADRNRVIKPNHVKWLAAIMVRGDWVLNGQHIIFGSQHTECPCGHPGLLEDGRHRLHAIIEAGIPVEFGVVYGTDANAQDTMDSGIGRTPADVLAIHGIESSGVIAAAVRTLIAYEAGISPGRMFHTSSKSDATVVREYVEEHPDVEDCWTRITRSRVGPVGGGLKLAVYVILHRANAEKAFEFMQAFQSGSGLENGNPILACRERLITATTRRQSVTKAAVFVAMIRCWNMWRADVRITVGNFPLLHKGTLPKLPLPVH